MRVLKFLVAALAVGIVSYITVYAVYERLLVCGAIFIPCVIVLGSS